MPIPKLFSYWPFVLIVFFHSGGVLGGYGVFIDRPGLFAGGLPEAVKKEWLLKQMPRFSPTMDK
ncbi:hypothetical protein NX722_00710 [Endozoicomonas gorgoniicola]|uniref:Uncharacterized protein n=1 Tax=Endozoicomonas gorgoniicola TaxID=1234144 RepID=A0ABT3MP95_9GAMM|nr:hypothetical protein [Endozoicomonas gorgoniicola]MCW7551200.1 hypothetical protein [Endozoicomonas gorgoniicola]